MRIARIEDGRVVEVADVADDADPAEIYHPSLDWKPVPSGVAVDQGWGWDGAGFVAPSSGQVDLVGLATYHLRQSDITLLRCFEAGMPLPPEWAAYRGSLRAIVAGGPGPVPARPPYPEGT